MGKMVHVAPYSGDMLPMVARVSSESALTPGPKASTNLPTTPWRRSSCDDGENHVGRGDAFARLADDDAARPRAG